jgi:hypothetical protein
MTNLYLGSTGNYTLSVGRVGIIPIPVLNGKLHLVSREGGLRV